jgi:hypothetical protein
MMFLECDANATQQGTENAFPESSLPVLQLTTEAQM